MAANEFLAYFEQKGITSGCKNFNDFPDNQLTKFRALQSEQ